MQITKEQKDLLEKFTCERLTKHEENKELIKDFDSELGKPLVTYLKGPAWEEDKQGVSAVYLVKAPNGLPCMYFAMKCGAVYQPLNEDSVRDEWTRAKSFMQEITERLGDKPTREQLIEVLEGIRQERNVSAQEIIDQLKQVGEAKSNLGRVLEYLETDKLREGNRPIQRVSSIFPGVEITHFCTNDNNKNFWKSYGIRHSMGAVLFWDKIAPKFVEIQNVVGCQFAFLFAADGTVDGNLTNYYGVSLKFSKPSDYGTSKPFYDFCCDFMSQEITDLHSNREKFFLNFNPDPEDIIV